MRTKLDENEKQQFNFKKNGAFFLAMGVAALFTIGALVYLEFTPEAKKQRAVNVTPESKSIEMAKKIDAKLPTSQSDMSIPQINTLQGRWVTRFNEASIAELTLEDGAFEIIYTDDPRGARRKYSRGNYEYDGASGRLTLLPSRQAGQPEAIQGVTYRVLTMRAYDFMVVKKNGGDSIYLIAPKADLATKRFHPLFAYADYTGAPVLQFAPVGQ